MSIHRALLMEDILTEVFEFLDYIGMYGKAGKPTLVNLARVSTGFHEPAIRILWRQVSTVRSIVGLLPSCFRAGNNTPDPETEISELPEDAQREWERVRRYGIHVRWLSVGNDDQDIRLQFNAGRWALIQRLSGGEPVFPNLTGMHWIAEEGNEDGLALFLAPPMQVLYIECGLEHEPTPENEANWASCIKLWINELPQRTPHLEKLSLRIVELSPSVVMAPLSLAAPRLPRSLTHLTLGTDLPSIDVPTLATLARLSNMEILEFQESIFGLDANRPRNRGELSGVACIDFPHLKTLILCMHPVENLVTNAMTSANLRTLYIQQMAYGNSESLRQRCAALAQAFPSLEKLWITTLMELEDVPAVPAILDLIAPFLGHRLRDVNIGFFRGWITSVPYLVNDDDIVAIAEAWPMLARLTIRGAEGMTLDQHSVGLRGLSALAKHCPDLQMIRIERLVVRPEDAAHLPLDTPIHGLRTLEVYEGITPETGRLISDRLFPGWRPPLE